METPCPRCGTLKTESVRHGFIYNTLWKMGYHLRRCSFCNRWRLLARGDRNRPHPNDLTAEELTTHFNRKIAAAIRRDGGTTGPFVKPMTLDSAPKPPVQEVRPAPIASVAVAAPAPAAATATATAFSVPAPVVSGPQSGSKEDYGCCPFCGNMRYRRSRRRWYERVLLKRPRMARCLKCAKRFPYPS